MSHLIILATAVLTLCVCAAVHGADGPVRLTVRDEVLNPIDDRLFGHFMERASWGEPGYDAARDPEHPHRLRPDVVEKLAWLDIPVIRFPAGSDLKRIDWRDMIDNVPGREGGRPIFVENKHGRLTNLFGLDEFLALCERLDSAPLLPVRLHGALLGSVEPEAAAREAAALVAYCNAEVGAELPAGMADWPAVRAANGRREPWGVPYFQIGNETWFAVGKALETRGLAEASAAEKAEMYLSVLRPYLERMHEVDPTIRIITDGVTNAGKEVDRLILADPVVREHVAYHALHFYQPWGIKTIKRDGEEVPASSLTEEEIWYAWVATPAMDKASFQARVPGWKDFRHLRELGYPLAMTEWNWNGWWAKKGAPLYSRLAQGLGAAGILHAFMREGGWARIGCQSMLVGTSWGITGVRVEEGEPPQLYPTALATGLYSRHHGAERLAVEIENLPTYQQPLQLNSIEPATVGLVDLLVTRTGATLYLHAINRDIARAVPVELSLAALGGAAGEGVHHVLSGPVRAGEETARADVTEAALPAAGETVRLALPARSVSVAVIPLAP
jgi:alpha-N-arabinofuranosidase